MRRTGINKGAVFGIAGILFVILGVILIIIGNNIFNNFYAQVVYYHQYGHDDLSGYNVRTIGIISTALGAFLLFISLYFNLKDRKKFSDTLHNREYDEVDDVITQMAGNRTIFDIFHSGDRGKTFSFYRDKTCILKVGDTVYRGKMEPLTWENGRPTLWRITVDMDGAPKSCEISKIEGNILVKSDGSEEIFYRN